MNRSFPGHSGRGYLLLQAACTVRVNCQSSRENSYRTGRQRTEAANRAAPPKNGGGLAALGVERVTSVGPIDRRLRIPKQLLPRFGSRRSRLAAGTASQRGCSQPRSSWRSCPVAPVRPSWANPGFRNFKLPRPVTHHRDLRPIRQASTALTFFTAR